MRVQLSTQGRFGNQMFQYAFARGYCEKYGHELATDDWIGRKIFEINDPLATETLPRKDELRVDWGEGGIEFRGYFQSQRAIVYTKDQVMRWFKLKPELEKALKGHFPNDTPTVAHLRRGDFFGYGYPVVSTASYHKAQSVFGLPPITEISEESVKNQARGVFVPFPFIVDFYRMVQAPNVLRANSSFSWWAAMLSDGKVYAPIVDGLEGGKEHDCDFVEGNWPRLSNHDFVTDLHVK